jgi:hypothetical protein
MECRSGQDGEKFPEPGTTMCPAYPDFQANVKRFFCRFFIFPKDLR